MLTLQNIKDLGKESLLFRAKQYDEWTKDFIAKNKNAVVVHLGCD